MSEFVQAPRRPEDGNVHVTRVHEGFSVCVVTHGKEEVITMSEHNAARVFALLGFMLANGGTSLLSRAARRITL